MISCSIKQLAQYSRCPKQAYYDWNNPPSSPLTDEAIISTIIKKIYVHHTRFEKLMPWRKVLRLTTSTFFDFIPTENRAAYLESKNYLTRISSWYNGPYLQKYSDEGIMNVPLKIGLGHHFSLTDTVELLTVGKDIKIFDFDVNGSLNKIMLYDDIIVHMRLWLLWKMSDTLPSKYVRIVIRPHTVTPVEIQVNKKMVENMEKTVKHLTRGIHDGVFYPSFSVQCDRCVHAKRCHL